MLGAGKFGMCQELCDYSCIFGNGWMLVCVWKWVDVRACFGCGWRLLRVWKWVHVRACWKSVDVGALLGAQLGCHFALSWREMFVER